MEGKDGKTEKATSKKREKAREEGNVCVSPELSSMGVLLLGIITLRFAGPMIWRNIGILFSDLVKFDALGEWNVAGVSAAFSFGCGFFFVLMAPIALPAVLGAIIANFAQVGPLFSTKALKWKFSELNPIKGVKKLFSMQAAMSLGLSLLKVLLIVLVLCFMVKKHVPLIVNMSNFSTSGSVEWMFLFIFKFVFTVTLVFSIIALLDWAFRKYKYEQKLMMTKQEVKDERKQQEVNPIVKRALFKKMRELSLSRMMADVPTADFIITNPTHVAVALKYDPDTMTSPKVVAKGLRLVAQRIKKIAGEHNIPIIERPPTARSIYKHVKIGQEIPSQFFEAVADVLAYLYRIGKSVAGEKTKRSM